MTITQLESAALEAHQQGLCWCEFWQQHGHAVKAAEPFSRDKLRRLCDRLLKLLLSGDTDGHEPVGSDPEPWLTDDAEQSKPSDTATRARCLFPLRPLPSTLETAR
jgi:hypothetical protein